MANRRMFSKTITSASSFLMMPPTAQNLYFHFGMNADDDGFCEHFTIMRMTDSKPDDLKILQAKQFVVIFDDKVLIVKDWKENNYIRSDRYTPSKYLEIYKEELKLIALNKDISGIPSGNQWLPQVRLGKVSNNDFDKQNLSLSDVKKITMDDEIQIVQIDEQGYPLYEKSSEKKKRPINKMAFYLQRVFMETAKKELGQSPIYNKAGYVLLCRALKKFSEKELELAIKDWFDEPKKDEDLIQITQCLSDNRLNRWKINQ